MKTISITVSKTECFGEQKVRPGTMIEVPADHRLAQIYGRQPADPTTKSMTAKGRS